MVVNVAVDDLTQMIGKRLLVGMSYLSATGEVEHRTEFVGTVVAVEPLVAIDRGNGGDLFTLPPAPEAFDKADPGEYHLKATGEVVVDPDYTTTWTVTAPMV